MNGVKFDGEKVRPSLLPVRELQKVLAVLEGGARKYSPDNWKKVERQRYVDAFFRHVLEYMEHEQNETGVCMDEDSGIESLAHVICNALFLLYKDEEKWKIEWKVSDSSGESVPNVAEKLRDILPQQDLSSFFRIPPVSVDTSD